MTDNAWGPVLIPNPRLFIRSAALVDNSSAQSTWKCPCDPYLPHTHLRCTHVLPKFRRNNGEKAQEPVTRILSTLPTAGCSQNVGSPFFNLKEMGRIKIATGFGYMGLATRICFAHIPRSNFCRTQALSAGLSSFYSWMPPCQVRPRRFLHKPLSGMMQPCLHNYFTTFAMSPAPPSSPTEERSPFAVAVYCGASPGTEPAFHHAAVCKIPPLLLAFPGA